MIEQMLNAIADSNLGMWIAQDPIAFPWIETAHVISITAVFGLILVVDLRLLGLAGRDYPVHAMSNALVPVTWIAFISAAITGTLLFTSNPVNYFHNFYFRTKMILMVIAGLNMLAFHFWTMRGIDGWDKKPTPPASVRAAGLISVLLWLTIIACGRWIGFTMAPF